MQPSDTLTCVRTSTLSSSSDGLFAERPIQAGTVIAHFRGQLIDPKTKYTDDGKRNVILFNDGFRLFCHADDRASCANDCVAAPSTPRGLLEALRSGEAFYRCHPLATLNAQVILRESDEGHTAHLVARRDIDQGEEIFSHRGFAFWFWKEASELGFLKEREIEERGFPETLHESRAFDAYLRSFYPDLESWTAEEFLGMTYVRIKFKESESVLMEVPSCRDVFATGSRP